MTQPQEPPSFNDGRGLPTNIDHNIRDFLSEP